RFGDLRRSTLSWCRRTRISASSAARDLNSPIKANQINLQRSLIGSEYQPIRSRSQRFWVCGRDRGLNGRDGLVQLFVRQAREGVSVFELPLLRHQQGANLKIGRRLSGQNADRHEKIWHNFRVL